MARARAAPCAPPRARASTVNSPVRSTAAGPRRSDRLPQCQIGP